MWITRWNAISSRIRGLRATTALFFDSFKAQKSDCCGVSGSHLVPEAKQILEALRTFRRDFSDVLPPTARGALDMFFLSAHEVFAGPSIASLTGAALALASIQDALDFHLAGPESVGRSITERAFEHLQRSIVVDDDQRAKWNAAYSAGEPTCEKLGAVHLLLHGIWGFKVGAKGEQTDLVFGEPLPLGHVERSAPCAIVLTEWKVARDAQEVASRFAEAKSQAARYAGGSLSDLELTTVRFLVVVSKKHVKVPPDAADGSVHYRHRLIAVDPDSPSVAAKGPA